MTQLTNSPISTVGPLSIKSILVPLDGSKLAEAAIAPAIAIALGLDATVTFLHVLEHDAPSTIHGEPHLGTVAAATKYLNDVAQQYAASGLTTGIHVHANPERNVSDAIASHGAELNADLLVLAAHGSGGIRGFLFGRVAQQVVRRGSRPVMVVPAKEDTDRERSFECERIAVLLNGTAEAEAVVPVTMALAKALDAGLHLISAVPTVGTLDADRSAAATLLPGAARAVLDIENEEIRSYLDRVSNDLRERGFRVSVAVVRGDPADATIDEARRADAGLLALATHGRQGLSGIWAGSVGTKVLTRYDRPLLLAHAPG